jgi:hypothetical protein
VENRKEITMILRQLFLAFACLLATTTVRASEPIADMDALESLVLTCVQQLGKESKCFEMAARRHIVPGSEDAVLPLAIRLDAVFLEWLGEHRVYRIHPLSRHEASDLFERRDYVVEDSTGGLLMLRISALRKLGRLYLFDFSINSGRQEIARALGTTSDWHQYSDDPGGDAKARPSEPAKGL